ncbi:DUF3994 domain-containing protein [Bacillus cereus group sp. BfR-BA-01310]|uniref:DUF3994 domain-containing protein n=1 Tax=Bacillus cereus group sp. BfR-BA-01310 TaxID=2920287 RepID=UPI001F596E8F|nr:hypothetical protein [Bacillus cereus group sp. BfR-BA-01310]
MKSRKLVALALPIMLLGGCATDKAETKVKDKVESKAETKEKLSKDQYPIRMASLASELMQKVSAITEMAMDKTKDEKTLIKEIAKEESDLQVIIKKFDKIEPPKEYQDSHKDILKAVDCYSKAYSTQVKLTQGKGKVTDKDKEKAKEAMELIYKGNDYWKSGYQPIEDSTLSKSNEIKDKLGIKSDSPSTSTSDNSTVQISQDGKELMGEWGSYKDGVFHKGIDFRQDETFTFYDDTGKSSFEDNHMEGAWHYIPEAQKVTIMPTEFVKDGQKIDAKQMKVAVDYKVEHLKDGSLRLVDDKGTTIEAVRRK